MSSPEDKIDFESGPARHAHRVAACSGQQRSDEVLFLDYARDSQAGPITGLCPACRGIQYWAYGRRVTTHPDDTCTCISSLKTQSDLKRLPTMDHKLEMLTSKVDKLEAESKRMAQQLTHMKSAATATFEELYKTQQTLSKRDTSRGLNRWGWAFVGLGILFLVLQGVIVLWNLKSLL